MPRLSLTWSSWGMLILSQSPVLAQIPLSERVFSPVKSSESFRDSPSKSLSSAQRSDLGADSYIIGPGDLLSLRVFSSPELSGSLPVLADGSISLPLVGAVRVAGLTPQQASRWIQELFSQDLLSPELQITVESPRPLKISLIGELQRPGLYTLGKTSRGSGADSAGLPTLITAIQVAGGITQAANITDVILQRLLPGEERRYKQTSLNLASLLFQGDQTQNPYLFDGDIVKISTATESPFEATELGATNINPNGINVQIVGEVVSPGIISMPSNTPLNKAILMAGSPVELRANKRNIELFRLNRNGTVTMRRLALNLSADVNEKTNPPLRDGDIVRVKRNLVAKGTDLINGVTQPLTGLVSAWGLVRLVQDQDNRR